MLPVYHLVSKRASRCPLICLKFVEDNARNETLVHHCADETRHVGKLPLDISLVNRTKVNLISIVTKQIADRGRLRNGATGKEGYTLTRC
jgi:hypothetical protein